jgi:hypothetical protein
MKFALLAVALSFGCCATTSAMAEQPPAERPPAPVNAPLSAESLFKQAQALTAQKQPDQAIAAWQQGLTLAPVNDNARLQLATVLIQQRRAVEAIQTLRPALQSSTDLVIFETLLNALRSAGSPIDLAMTAEEAVAKHPTHTGLLLTATEALLAVDATDRAFTYWQKLPQTAQTATHAQWLLGRIHETKAKPALAWAAYTKAAVDQPKAKAALQRLSAQSMALSGWRYFAPPKWVVVRGEEATVQNLANGTRASLRLMPKTTVNQAIQAAILQRLPLPFEDIAALLTQPKPDAQALVQLTRLPCPNTDTNICVHVGANAAFSGLLPEVLVGVRILDNDAMTVSIDNSDRNIALQALIALSQKALLVPEGVP